ncbi:MAG: hypothetical protein LDL24_10425 [Treponema sp.]|nr:hypothetical protein [Treponema sp.]
MKNLLKSGLLIGLILSSSSCFLASPEKELKPPATFPLSRSALGYVLITDTYTQLLDSLGNNSVSLGVLRKGSILPVLERRIVQSESKAERWILVMAQERGWIRESSGRLFATEAQAKTALNSMQERE